MNSEQLGIVIDIGLIVAVVGLGLAGGAGWIINKTIDPTMQQLFISVLGLLQARLGLHILAIRAEQKAQNGQTTPTKEG